MNAAPTSSAEAALKRSNKPIFWSMFGAGGMLSALTGPMLVFVTLIAVPTGLLLSPHSLAYARVLAFAGSWFGKLALLVIIWLYLFHAFHRFYHTLHDLGVHVGSGLKAVCHGAAGLLTLYALTLLLRL